MEISYSCALYRYKKVSCSYNLSKRLFDYNVAKSNIRNFSSPNHRRDHGYEKEDGSGMRRYSK